MIVDRRGTTRAAVIDFGGFLGVGSREDCRGLGYSFLYGDLQAAMTSINVREPRGIASTRRLNSRKESRLTVLGAHDEAARTQVTLKAFLWVESVGGNRLT